MMQKVNLSASANSIPELFKYVKVGQLNDHMLNLVIVENRILDFHIHEDSDEMFYVVEGQMKLEFDEGLVELNRGDFIIVPKGKRHRPVCDTLVKCLLIEKAGTLTKENTGGTYQE
jgi:mannose-6-phosphate isomerase-like protein (cupin superfamily)